MVIYGRFEARRTSVRAFFVCPTGHEPGCVLMPYAPPTLRPRGSVGVAERDYDARRRDVAWRAWYKTGRWRRLRDMQLNSEPLCRMCVEVDRLTPATVCDHVEPHRGDETLFWSGPFQSLCVACHNRDKQRIERGP